MAEEKTLTVREALEAVTWANEAARGASNAEELDELSDVAWTQENAPKHFTPRMGELAQHTLLEHYLRAIGRA